MTVAFKSPLTSANVNAAFMSKNSDTGTTGKINQTNITDATDETDGAFHTEGGMSVAKKLYVGDSINAVTFFNLVKDFASQSVVGGGTVSADVNQTFQMRRVVGNAGPAVLSLSPFGDLSSATKPILIMLIGQDDTNTVTITYSDTANGAYVNGEATLKKGYSIFLIWDPTNQRLYELCRNF